MLYTINYRISKIGSAILYFIVQFTAGCFLQSNNVADDVDMLFLCYFCCCCWMNALWRCGILWLYRVSSFLIFFIECLVTICLFIFIYKKYKFVFVLFVVLTGFLRFLFIQTRPIVIPNWYRCNLVFFLLFFLNMYPRRIWVRFFLICQLLLWYSNVQVRKSLTKFWLSAF